MNVSSTFLTLVLLWAGCASEVGDPCETNTECGIDLVCDTTQKDGYCTRTPCEVNKCPDEAVCIEFPDESTFCMRRCDSSGDCRGGYICVQDYGDLPFCSDAPFLGPNRDGM